MFQEHLHRHLESPGFKLLCSQNDSLLRERRLEAGRFSVSHTANAGAAGTRAGAGFPIIWTAGWFERVGAGELEGVGVGWENVSRSKRICRLRGQFLRSMIFDVQTQLAIGI